MDTNPHNSSTPSGKTIREDVLDTAKTCVVQDRASSYGGPEQSFQSIALHWSAHLAARGILPPGQLLTPTDVATMMALLKVARLSSNPCHWDSWVDLAGYAACGAEVSYPPAPTMATEQADTILKRNPL